MGSVYEDSVRAQRLSRLREAVKNEPPVIWPERGIEGVSGIALVLLKEERPDEYERRAAESKADRGAERKAADGRDRWF